MTHLNGKNQANNTHVTQSLALFTKAIQLLVFEISDTQEFQPVLGAFAKLRRVAISFVMSVRLSLCSFDRTEELGSHWIDFLDFYI